MGADELKAGLVTVKEQKWELIEGKKVKIESADKGRQVKRDELVQLLKSSETWKEWTGFRL
jgi:histidyl-tRNA synthetase